MYGNGGWAWMAVMPLIWIALIGLIVWAAVRLTQQSPQTRRDDRDRGEERSESAQEILDRRFASGEIDADSYTEARRRIAGKP